MLAGMSSDYYVRLEQEWESSPAPQVVEAVARALSLDEEATEHLHRLIQPPVRRRAAADDHVSPQLLQLMDSWPTSPAFVLGPALDILAANTMATALHEGFTAADNLAPIVFTDPAGREFYQDWERAAHSCVAELRTAYGHDPKSARINQLVDELCSASPEFAELWARHEVKSKRRRASTCGTHAWATCTSSSPPSPSTAPRTSNSSSTKPNPPHRLRPRSNDCAPQPSKKRQGRCTTATRSDRSRPTAERR